MTDTTTVRLHASKIARQIQLAANASKGDEKAFREKVAPLFEQFADDTKIDLRQHDEYTLVTGRADTVYNRLVIEYEHPSFLRDSNEYASNKHAIQQVKDYIEGIQKRERHDVDRLVGAVLDGYFLIFVRHVGDSWRVDDPLRVDAVSVEYLLELLVKTSTGVALIPDNLIEDFGSKTLNAQRTTRSLYHALEGHKDDLVARLFEQWQTFFGEVTGYEEGSARLRDKKELRAFAKGMGISPDVADPPRLFFSVHTYFAILIKLIAWLTLSRYNARLAPQFAELKDLDSADLRARLERMERGALFREEFRIRNFLEGDFFGWYLKAWTPDIEKQIRNIVEKLSNYDPTTLEVSPEQTRDLLKKLYHYLMPRELRHDLGEYYTPDWLAERLLTQVDSSLFQPLTTDAARRQTLAYAQKNLLKLRFLDPACGSGTFLVLTIRRIRDLAQRLKMETSNEKRRWVLDAILNNVQGIDLNPLAVIAARTNYILALGDLLQIPNRPEIDIPIYLADSILTPSQSQDIFSAGNYRIKTTVGEFLVPEAFNTKDRVDALAHALDEAVEAKPRVSADNFVARVKVAAGLSDRELEATRKSLTDLYKQLSDLHAKGLNGVWARIIKNAFMPLFIGKFDYVVGNPPWVNWESLPEDYRRATFPLWSAHKLFSHKGFDAILGKSKDDISVLMTYVALDKYVRDKGRLGFVITQSVFKTAGAGQGFRRFQLGDGTPLGIIAVDDMAELKPFEGAANRTAIFVLERGRTTKYPVPYSQWFKPDGGSEVPEEMSLEQITAEKVATYRRFAARPVDDADRTSSWITGRAGAMKAVKKVLGKSDYEARAGVCTWLNGVFWFEIIGREGDGLVVVNNMTEGTKREVESVQRTIESDLLYPLLRGGDVGRWQAEPSAHILLTHKKGMRLKAIPEKEMASRFPKTHSYLKKFEPDLRSRSGYRRYFREDDPFYSVFNVGDYTFAPYKVVWPNIASELGCAVVSSEKGKVIIPQHIVTLVAFENAEEAHYVCSVVNSAPANFTLQSYSQKGGKSFGTPHVLENIRVPHYDSTDSTHRALATLSQKAHALAAEIHDEGTSDAAREKAEAKLREVEAEIDTRAAELWGLTKAELEEIKRSLEELG